LITRDLTRRPKKGQFQPEVVGLWLGVGRLSDGGGATTWPGERKLKMRGQTERK